MALSGGEGTQVSALNVLGQLHGYEYGWEDEHCKSHTVIVSFCLSGVGVICDVYFPYLRTDSV